MSHSAGHDIYANIPNHDSHLVWYKNKGLFYLNMCIIAVFTAQALNGYDGALIGSFQAMASWQETVGHPTSSELGLLNAVMSISGFVTSPFAYYISDTFGRRFCIRYTAVTNLLGTALGCAAGAGNSNGYAMFIVSRIIIGSGIAFALMISPIMLQELPHPKHRTKLAGFFDCAFNIGGFIAAWVTFGCTHISSNWSWRIPYLIHIGPAFVMLILVQFVPESPRWLMKQGRDEEAMRFLTRFHANGHENDELALFEFAEIKETLELEKTLGRTSWSSLLASKGNRHRIACALLIGACQNLSGTSIIAYYYTSILKLVGITDPGQQTGINAGLTSFVFFCALGGLYMTQYMRRRPQLAISWIGTLCANIGLIVSTAIYVNKGHHSAGIAAVVFVWLYDGFFFIACGPLFFSYQAEILTYSIRAKGMMLWSLFIKAISIFNYYVNPIAMSHIGWKYYLVYTGTLIVTGILMYFLIVETKGYTLEEIAELFDGKEFHLSVDDEVLAKTNTQPAYVLDDDSSNEKKDAAAARVASVEDKV